MNESNIISFSVINTILTVAKRHNSFKVFFFMGTSTLLTAHYMDISVHTIFKWFFFIVFIVTIIVIFLKENQQ